ncbi:hypothetical protein B0H13DRAFT_1927609 [Mycena leptocephala]|nr:hypothetical protein B0H13DRAFT_1927609 [Mycena leptocephala]
MSNDKGTPKAVEVASTARTEFLSAPSNAGPNPALSIQPVSDVASGNDLLDVASNPANAGPSHSAPSISRARSPDIHVSKFALLVDSLGRHYVRDAHGQRFEVQDETHHNESNSETSRSGVPIHHTNLFSMSKEPSTESVLSDSTPADAAADKFDGFPQLELDIDPDTLDATQVAQLNAIRGHLGTAQERLIATTAIIAEQQAATEDIQEGIQTVRREVLSRVDSLRNEVNSQRSRLNRCLNDNLKIIQETGASGDQVKEILHIMNRNGGSHRMELPAPSTVEAPSIAPRNLLQPELRATLDAAIPPRAEGELTKDFDRRARSVLRTKDNAHNSFPLPSVEEDSASRPPKTARFVPPVPVDPYHSEGSASRANAHRSEIAHAKGELQRLRMLEAAEHRGTPVVMHNSASAYLSGMGSHDKDPLTEFADETEAAIRETIESKVGFRTELPPGVRPPRVADPIRYRGQDDHDFFVMEFLEKMLSWLRSQNYGGDDLDWYRTTLLQNYLEGEAHRWNKRSATQQNVSISLEWGRYLAVRHTQRRTTALITEEWRSRKPQNYANPRQDEQQMRQRSVLGVKARREGDVDVDPECQSRHPLAPARRSKMLPPKGLRNRDPNINIG